MIKLPRYVRISLAALSADTECMGALITLIEAMKLDAINKVKPPMSLDEYGALVGAQKLLSDLIEEVNKSSMIASAMQE